MQGLWASLNPQLLLTSIGAPISHKEEKHEVRVVSANSEGLPVAWQFADVKYYVTSYALSRCYESQSQSSVCSFPNICQFPIPQLDFFSWELQGRCERGEAWSTLHRGNSSMLQSDKFEQEINYEAEDNHLKSVHAVRLLVTTAQSPVPTPLCLSGLDISGKFDLNYNLWIGINEYWNKTKETSPALRMLSQIIENGHVQNLFNKGEPKTGSERLLKSCLEQFSPCFTNWLSLSCLKSLPSASSQCMKSTREVIALEFEAFSWVSHIQSIGSRFIVESVVGGALRLFGTAFSLMWNIFMLCLDIWVFLVVLVNLMFSDEGILPWMLISFTTLDKITIQQIILICTRDIHGVFVSLFKIAMFHSIFSWFTLSLFELDFPFSIGVLSGMTCLVDERIVLLWLIPGALELWMEVPTASSWQAVLLGVSSLPHFNLRFVAFFILNLWRCAFGSVGANIFRGNTVVGDLHPMIIGWSVFGGISLLQIHA